MSAVWPAWLRRGAAADEALASAALAAMMVLPLVEIALRPLLGRGVENAPVLVQHLGLVLAMLGAVAAERHGHLPSLAGVPGPVEGGTRAAALRGWVMASAALICGLLVGASWQLVASERAAGQVLAYGMPVWWIQATMPLGFALLGLRLGARCGTTVWQRGLGALLAPGAGLGLALGLDGQVMALWPAVLWLVVLLLAGAPIFAVLGGLALALFWSEGLPLASIALSHYQITVNPSLPALPLFTLAGLVFARTAATRRLGDVFLALFGTGVQGTVVAVAVLCSAFTAFTGGSGVTILALGGLLLPLLTQAGYPERRGIGLVTSASALGVLLAPSVPLIMYAVIARVPITDMFLAGVLPAVVMVACLLAVSMHRRRATVGTGVAAPPDATRATQAGTTQALGIGASAWAAKWELLAPVVAIGSLASGLATPTESAALTAAYAVLTQAWAHRELGWSLLGRCLAECARLIGGVMLILGMALALTNYLIDAGIPDLAVEHVQRLIPSQGLFLLALCLFLFAAAALMEIFAALAVLVPLLLPLTRSYGIDPVHFGIIFLAAMEVGFLCPPAGMNLYFASAMFKRPLRQVAVSVLPSVLAIMVGTLLIAAVPWLSTGLVAWASSGGVR